MPRCRYGEVGEVPSLMAPPLCARERQPGSGDVDALVPWWHGGWPEPATVSPSQPNQDQLMKRGENGGLSRWKRFSVELVSTRRADSPETRVPPAACVLGRAREGVTTLSPACQPSSRAGGLAGIGCGGCG
jgi:hypothetical protein